MKLTPEHNGSLPLGEAISRQLQQERLDDEQVRQLLAMQEAVLGSRAERSGSWFSGARLGPLAAIAMLLVCTLLAWQGLAPPVQNYSEQIALEVIENHLKLKPLDVASDSMRDIQGFFTQLDFSPVSSSLLSSRFRLSEGSMLGGRYCSIQGVSAAQLRYQRADDGVSTLYEVAYDPEIFGAVPSVERGEPPLELLLKGLRVSLWVEKGLLMVLVNDA